MLLYEQIELRTTVKLCIIIRTYRIFITDLHAVSTFQYFEINKMIWRKFSICCDFSHH